MGINALSSVSSNAWNYVKAMGQAAKETVKDINAKDVAAYWTGKDAKDVTGSDIAKTFVLAAAPYLAIAGCGGPEVKAIGGGGKTGKPQDVSVTLGEGWYTQTFSNLRNSKLTIVLTGYIKTPPLEGYDKFFVKAGLLNYKAASEKMIPDLSSCDPKNGHLECDPDFSCRIQYAGGTLDTPPQGSALRVVDDTNLETDLVIDANAPDGGRQLLVEWNGNKYLSTNTFSPSAGDKGHTILNVRWSFVGTTFSDSNLPLEWAKLIDPAACNFAVSDVLKLFTGVDGAQAYSWLAIVGKDAKYGKLLPSDEIAKPVPITVNWFYIEHVKYPGDGYYVEPKEPNNIFGDFDGANAFMQDVPTGSYCPGKQSNCMDYFDGPFTISLDMNGTGLGEQDVDKVLAYLILKAYLQ